MPKTKTTTTQLRPGNYVSDVRDPSVAGVLSTVYFIRGTGWGVFVAKYLNVNGKRRVRRVKLIHLRRRFKLDQSPELKKIRERECRRKLRVWRESMASMLQTA